MTPQTFRCGGQTWRRHLIDLISIIGLFGIFIYVAASNGVPRGLLYFMLVPFSLAVGAIAILGYARRRLYRFEIAILAGDVRITERKFLKREYTFPLHGTEWQVAVFVSGGAQPPCLLVKRQNASALKLGHALGKDQLNQIVELLDTARAAS